MSVPFVMCGAGFWAKFQLAAWREIGEAECIAVCDPQPGRAQAFAAQQGIPQAFTSLARALRAVSPRFIDIVSDVASHAPLIGEAIAHSLPVICQKPLAATMEEVNELCGLCESQGVMLLVHENWRWQSTARALKEALASNLIGPVHRARISMISGFPVFRNQPALMRMEQMIIADLGVHLLDTARFLFGEFSSLYAQTHRVTPGISGEDVATVMLRTSDGSTTVVCEMAYAGNALERECFPQTLYFVEGSRGSIEVTPGYEVRVTTSEGVSVQRAEPVLYPWADPSYAIVQSSMPGCLRNLLDGITGAATPETTASDQRRTMQLVFAAYDSARQGRAILLETTADQIERFAGHI